MGASELANVNVVRETCELSREFGGGNLRGG